jgi:hypothetical protein
LQEEGRETVEKAVSELWNNEKLPFTIWKWENAKEIPSGKHPDEVQSEGVRDSDIYVLILGSKYGDFEYGKSPTHTEYEMACSELEEDHILIYIREAERREEKLEQWIDGIKGKHTFKSFKNSDQLKDLVKTRLRDLWNKGELKEVVINEIVHGPKRYYYCDGDFYYKEYFDADKLKVETKGEDNSKSFISFLVNLLFHNDDHDTTIYHIALTAFTEDEKTTTIPDMIKLDDGKWEKFDSDEFTCRIDKNTSKRIFFRFISKDFLVYPEILVKLELNHSSGDFEVSSSSKFIEKVDDINWTKGSSAGTSDGIIRW